MFRLVKNNRGFSVVEVVIAMAIVGLVTAAALVIMVGSVESTQNTLNEAAAQNFVANAVECYIAADGDRDVFALLMSGAAGYSEDGGCPLYISDIYGTCNLPGGYQGQLIITEQALYVCVRDEQGNMYLDWLTYTRGAK